MYLAYARHDPAIGADAVLGAARLLLNAGADPNAGYLWNGLPTPFTVLTGVFGEGERGPTDQPRHPHSLALARVLLEAGADPNDGQALYNRMFLPDDDHLELLFEFGLGTGDGGPWKRRMGDALDPPAAMLRGELGWAITHGMAERVRLLAEHGVDLLTPYEDGTSTTAMAATTGHPELIELLVELGFDINAMGRADVPSNQPWQTALHKAAEDGDLELARALLRLGADPDLKDARFGGNPLRWARYFNRQPIIELLEPVTTPEAHPENDLSQPA
jgi:ankyrin repeat protein